MKSTLFVLLAALAAATAVSVNFESCPQVAAETCVITDVDINPCKEHPRTCRLKKGADSNIAVKFTPNFATTNLTAGVFWVNGAIEPPFPDMDSNGCKFTSCPTVPGQEHLFNYSLHISKKFPQGTFATKWKFTDAENDTNICCFIVTIILRK